MSNLKNGSGSCLCGAVRFSTDSMGESVGACHCEICRRWGGGPFMEVDCGSNISFEGAENISVFSSSSWAERGFCSKCGTHLFMRVSEGNEIGLPEGYGIPAGLFDNDEDLSFNLQVFTDKKPAYYNFSDQTKCVTSDEVYEKHPQVGSIDR